MEAETTLPLSGVKVLDLSRLAPGGFCSLMLADFGADVIKIEDTGSGDYIRWSSPAYNGGAGSASGAYFLAFNRGKQSVRLDLKSQDGHSAFLRLVSHADVVLDGFRPGVMERLGLGYDDLALINPAVIHASITGYGKTGPRAQQAGHDLNYLAQCGALELTGELDGPPVIPGPQIADLAGGALMAVIGILLALRERDRSGRGQAIDASMYDGTTSLMLVHAAEYLATGQVQERGSQKLTGGLACYLPYLCKDGWISLAAYEPKFWRALCLGLEREDLIEHHLAATGSWAHGQLELIFMRRTKAEWEAFDTEHNCCLAPVLTVEEALESELARARQMIIGLTQPGVPQARSVGVPIKLSRTPGDPLRRPAPRLGEHTEEVLSAAGLTDGEIATLIESGAAAGLADDIATPSARR